MLPEPLHPALVHIPITLAVLLPVVAIVALLAIRRTGNARPIWAVMVVTAALLAGTSRLAMQTGETQEDIVENVVPHDAIEEHEEAGERLFLVSLAVLAIAAAGLIRHPIGSWARVAATVTTIVTLAAVFSVGKSGGALVYEHGAASAYVDGGTRVRDELAAADAGLEAEDAGDRQDGTEDRR